MIYKILGLPDTGGLLAVGGGMSRLLPGSPDLDADGSEFVAEWLQFADLKSDRPHREESQDLFAHLVGYFLQQMESLGRARSFHGSKDGGIVNAVLKVSS